MTIKNKIIWTSVGVVLFALVAVPAVMLFQGISQFGEAEQKLAVARGSLEKYYRMDPFPSQENIEALAENAETINAWSERLLAACREGQVISEEKSPSVFMDFLSRTLISLRKTAEKEKILLPGDDFAFGLDRYIASPVPPAPDDVPRLTDQLVAIDILSRLLFEEKIIELVAVQRDKFEGSAPVGAVPESDRTGRRVTRRDRETKLTFSPPPFAFTGSPSVGEVGEGELHACLHFAVEFKAGEKALLNILNRLGPTTCSWS
jgi:hypothetical protein